MSRSAPSISSHDEVEGDESGLVISRGRVPSLSLVDTRSAGNSESDFPSQLPSRLHVGEQSGLLTNADSTSRNYMSTIYNSRPRFSRHQSGATSVKQLKYPSRSSSLGARLANSVGHGGLSDSKGSLFPDERVWYDQFTSTDWVHDSIADNFRVRDLRSRKDFRGRFLAWFDGAEGWVLVAIIGFVTACIVSSNSHYNQFCRERN